MTVLMTVLRWAAMGRENCCGCESRPGIPRQRMCLPRIMYMEDTQRRSHTNSAYKHCVAIARSRHRCAAHQWACEAPHSAARIVHYLGEAPKRAAGGMGETGKGSGGSAPKDVRQSERRLPFWRLRYEQAGAAEEADRSIRRGEAHRRRGAQSLERG